MVEITCEQAAPTGTRTVTNGRGFVADIISVGEKFAHVIAVLALAGAAVLTVYLVTMGAASWLGVQLAALGI